MFNLRIASEEQYVSPLDQIARECVHQSAGMIFGKQLELVVDVESYLPVCFDLNWLKQAIMKMLNLAIERSPNCSEIQLTACCVGDAVELEVADNGDTLDNEATAFRHQCSYNFGPIARDLLASVQSRGAEFWGTCCPQGGMAWTLRMPLRKAMAKAA
ncbi:MAG: hypothetical protein SFV81_01935 [Pirellulaceae bacterium]|nr:hypothetical protein [Pirellulaceae bacterium]